MTMTAYHVLAQRKQLKKQRKDESLMKFNDEIFYKIPPEIETPKTRGEWREKVIRKMYKL